MPEACWMAHESDCPTTFGLSGKIQTARRDVSDGLQIKLGLEWDKFVSVVTNMSCLNGTVQIFQMVALRILFGDPFPA
jgi:hypothetical protein